MKKVVIVNKKDQPIIGSNGLSEDSHVGIKWEDGHKTWVTMRAYGEFVSLRIGDNDVKAKWEKNSVAEYVEDVYKISGAIVYCFDTKKELVDWLITE